MNTGISIDGLTVARGHRRILDHLTCRIRRSAVTGLLGPSGAGKTTMIRSIVGVQRITGGSITVLGAAAGSPSLRARTGYVTQSPSVYAELTVTENVRYFAAIAGAPATAVTRAMDETGLTEAARQPARTLSGGQRARASLACALVTDPELLVLDEPTVGQDPLLREELWDAFHRRATAGATVLVSSHVMDEASRCDELLLIRDGALLAADTPDGIRRAAGEADLDAAFLALIRRAQDGGRDGGTDRFGDNDHREALA
jgi:ABC-2 type transport system ATP-binding protein